MVVSFSDEITTSFFHVRLNIYLTSQVWFPWLVYWVIHFLLFTCVSGDNGEVWTAEVTANLKTNLLEICTVSIDERILVNLITVTGGMGRFSFLSVGQHERDLKN